MNKEIEKSNIRDLGLLVPLCKELVVLDAICEWLVRMLKLVKNGYNNELNMVTKIKIRTGFVLSCMWYKMLIW